MKITKTKKGLFRARVYVGRDENNRPVQRVFTDIDKARLRLTISQYLDEHRDGTDLRIFKDAMRNFIKVKTPVLSPSTMREYEGCRKLFLNRYPDFCNLALSDIRQSNVQDIVNDMVGRGLSPKSVRNYIGFISSVLTTAAYRMPIATLPQKIKPEYNVPSEETMMIVMKAAAGTNLEIPLSLAVFGLRRSEIMAMKPEDIEGNIVHIRRAAVRNVNGKVVEKTTKTYESDRFVQIPASLANKIRKQGYVIDCCPETFSRRLSRFLAKHGIDHFRLHDLRHFFVSYCHNILRLPDAQIQKLGGWKTDYVMKSRYLQSMNEKQSAMLVANKMQKIIG